MFTFVWKNLVTSSCSNFAEAKALEISSSILHKKCTYIDLTDFGTDLYKVVTFTFIVTACLIDLCCLGTILIIKPTRGTNFSNLFCLQLASKLSENLCDIYHCCAYSVKLQMMDRGTPKHVEFYSKINLRN